MAHSSVADSPGTSARLRTVRADGTPVYRYEPRAGVPPVSMIRFDTKAAHTVLPPDHRHAHDFLVLVYVEDSTGSIMVADAERPLRAGEVVALSPGQVIGLSAVSELAHCRAWSVAFTQDAVPAVAEVSPLAWGQHELLAMFAPGAGHGLVAEADRARWSAWLADLAEELADPGRLGSREVVCGLLTRTLVAAARLAPTTTAVPDPLIERAFDEIEATFREPISARDVARALGYTPGYLTTVVRERTGRALLEWIIERRMTDVRRLLRETDLPLGVVAAQTGLRDATYLVRRFRARYGTTPQRWRRSQRASASPPPRAMPG
jgi:AraC-like DNA-binding protein/quercetin dioxygenase-like cupin family protein